ATGAPSGRILTWLPHPAHAGGANSTAARTAAPVPPSKRVRGRLFDICMGLAPNAKSGTFREQSAATLWRKPVAFRVTSGADTAKSSGRMLYRNRPIYRLVLVDRCS